MMFTAISPSARAMADALEFGELDAIDIDGHGISEISAAWGAGHTIQVSWYSSTGSPRSLVINGVRTHPAGKNANYIFAAAKRRAKKTADEFYAKLDADALAASG